MPSIIVSIPFSRFLRHAVARSCRKRPSQTGERLQKAPKCTVINSRVSEALDMVQIHPSSLSGTSTISSWCSSVTAGENRKVVEFGSRGQKGVKVTESKEGDASSCRDSVEVQQQQLYTGSLQSLAKNHSPVPCKDYPHTFISCAVDDSTEDRPCNQPLHHHETTTQPLQQNTHRSESSSQDCADGIGSRTLEIQSLDKAKQRPELHAQQSRTMQCDEVSKNDEASVPLDVLELINRLKAIAKERMIEETVAKLMNMNASRQKSPMIPAHTPPVDSLAKTCSKIDGKQFEDRQSPHAEELCSGHVEKMPDSCLLSLHKDFSPQTHKDCVAGAGNDLNWQNDMKSCGIYCESFVKPATQSCEPFQGTDDSPADSCKHVSPLLLRRETGSVKDKFKIVKSHLTKTCTERSSKADTSDRHIWKLMPKDYALKAEKDSWDRSREDCALRTEKEFWDRSCRREKSAFIFDDLEPDDPLTNPTKSSLNTWQHYSDVQQVFMVHKDNVNIDKEPTAHAFAENVDLEDISGSIAAFIGSDVPDTNSEACDSDDIVKQIDKILSESNSPVHVVPFHSTGPEEPAKENCMKTDTVSPKPDDEQVELKDYHQENAQNVFQVFTPVTDCETVKNTQQIDSKSVLAHQEGLDVIEKFTDDLKSSKKKKRGPRRKRQKKGAGISVSSKSSGTTPKSCIPSLPADSESSHGLNTAQKLGNLHTLSLKPCSVVVHDLKSSGLQLNAKDRYMIRLGEIESVGKSPDISCNQNFSKNHNENGDTSHGSWESEITVCDTPQACESFVSAELQEDVAVSIQLEGSQPLVCRIGSTVFADSEPELKDEKKAGSPHIPQIKRRERSECLRKAPKAKKCRVSSDEQRLSPTCFQKAPEVPVSEQAGKTSSCSPKVPKICTNLNKKQSSITGKRKVKQTPKPSLRNTYTQGSASKNHSWDDVLQEMSILSASSCSNKTQPELSRFKIPKKTKEPDPGKEDTNLTSAQKQESDEHSASDEEMGKFIQSRWTKSTGVPGMHSNMNHNKKNCSYRQEKQFHNKNCHPVLGNQENEHFSLSQNKMSHVPVTANFIAPHRTASQSHAPSRASSTTTGPFIGQKPPENNGSQNFEYFGGFPQVPDVQQQNFQIFQSPTNFPSQKKPEIAQAAFDGSGGYRAVTSHEASAPRLKYTCGTKTNHQTGFANAQLSRDPRKRALMNRGYAGMKKTAPPDFLSDPCRESSDSDTPRVDSFNQSPYLKDSCREKDLNAQTSVQKCPPSLSAVEECMSIKRGSAFHDVSETTPEMFSRKLDKKFCRDTEANGEICALQENGSTQNAPQASECASIAIFSPSANQKMLDRDAGQTKTIPEFLDAGDGLPELGQDLLNTNSSNVQQEILQVNACDARTSVEAFQKPVEIQTRSISSDNSIMSASHEILQNSPLFVDGTSEVSIRFQSAHIESPVSSNGSAKKTEQNICEQNLPDDFPVEDQTVHGVLKYSDTDSLGNLERCEEVNRTVTIFTSSSVASQNCQDVIKAKMEQNAASDRSDIQTFKNTVVKETIDDLEKSLQSTAKDSVDQHTSENVPVQKVTEEPTGIGAEVRTCEISNTEFQELSESNISHHVPDVIAIDEEVGTSVESVENITETSQNDGQFTERAAETDTQLSAAEEVKLTHDHETCWEPCIESGTSSSGNMSAGTAEAWTSGLSCQSVFAQHTEVVHNANTNLSHDLMGKSASSVSYVKKSPIAAVTPPNGSTSPSNVLAGLPASEANVSEVVESSDSLQEQVPSPNLKAQADCKSEKGKVDKEISLPEQFTVLDECGDPDTSSSIYDAILKHFSTESGFQSNHGQSKESLKGGHSENSSPASPAASKKESNFKKPHLPRGVLLDFANTVMKNCQLNKKVDEEKKKRSEKSMSLLRPEPSSAEQTNTAGSSIKSESSSHKRRSSSQPAERQSRSRSPRNRKTPSPAGDKGAETKSSRDQRRSKSPSNRRRARSRSPSGSRAGSPSRRSERDDRRPGPTRCRDREQIVEDRHHRQYRPYDAQYSRDRGRRGGWNRGRRYDPDENKPEANFNLVINEFCELLADNTSKTFQKRLDEKKVSLKTLFNDKCYKNQRFRGYCFRRSRIPSYREFRSDLAATRKKAESAKKVASIDSKKGREPEEKEERTRLMAQLLDEYMGELDEPGKSDGAQVKKTPSDRQPSATASATTVIIPEPQGSSGVQDTLGDDDQSSAQASHSSSATSISGEGYTSSDTVLVSENSSSSIQKDVQQETTNSSPLNDPNSFGQQGLSGTRLSALSPKNSQAKHSIQETFIQLNVCDMPNESTEMQSSDKLLDDVLCQGHLPQPIKEQRQSLHADPEHAENASQKEEEQGVTEAPSRELWNRTGGYGSSVQRIRSVCETPSYDRSVLPDEHSQAIPVLVSPYCSDSSSGRTPVGDQDTLDVLRSQPTHRGPHTPPGPCPEDSPTLSALQSLSEDISAFLKDESLGEGNSFIDNKRFSAGSCSGFQATSQPSKPESLGFSFEPWYGRYPSGHILHPEQTYGLSMAGDRTASASSSNTRSLSQVQVSQSELQACSESNRLQSTSHLSNPVLESSGLHCQAEYSRLQSGSVRHPGHRYDPRLARDRTASGLAAAADHTRSPNQAQASDTSRPVSQTGVSENEIQAFPDSWMGEKNLPFSLSPFTDSNQRPGSNSCAVGSEPAKDGPARSLFQMCQKPSSTSVLKIINTAKLNASMGHDGQSLTLRHDGQSSTLRHDGQSSTCSQPTAASCRPSHTAADTGVLSTSSETPLSAVVCTGVAGRQVLAPGVPGPDVQASGQDEDGVGCEAVPAGEQDASQAKENMDRLVLQIQQQLQAYIATVEQAGNDKVHSGHTVLHPRGRRRSRRRDRVPWKLRLWPGTPAVITFDEERIPDYRPHPSLAKQCDSVKVIVQGADPRLDPDRPAFVAGGKSKLAANCRAKKRRVLISIKVVKDIPLEPVHQAGRELPKDPRHPFRSNVDEADHSDKDEMGENSSSGTDLDERELGNTRVMPLENGQIVSDEVHNSQTDSDVVVNDSEVAQTQKEETHEIEDKNTPEKSSQVIQPEQQGGVSEQTELEKRISMCEVEESRSEQPDSKSDKPVCTSECQPHSPQLDTEQEETSRNGQESSVGLPENQSSQPEEPEQLNSVAERDSMPEHQDAQPKQQHSPVKQEENDSTEENHMEHEDCSDEGENLGQEKGNSEQEENTAQLENVSEEKESHSQQNENTTEQRQQFKESSSDQPDNSFQQKANNLERQDSLTTMLAYKPEQEKLNSEQEEIDRVQENLKLEQVNTEECDSMTEQLESCSKQGAECWEQSEHNSDQVENDSDQQEKSQQQEIIISVAAELSGEPSVNEVIIGTEHQTAVFVMAHSTDKSGQHSVSRPDNISAEIAHKSNRNEPPPEQSSESRTEQSLIAFSPKVSGDHESLHKRKRPSPASSVSLKKKARLSTSEEACFFEDTGKSRVSRQSGDVDTCLANVSQVFLNHREALNQELLDDIMHLDSDDNSSPSGTDTTFPETSDSDSTSADSCSSTPAAATDSHIIPVEKLPSKNCPLKLESAESRECDSNAAVRHATMTAVDPCQVVEVIEILSSSEISDLEEGEIRETSPKPLYRTRQETQPLSKSVLRSGSLSRNSSYEEGEVREIQENDVTIIDEQFLPQTTTVSKSVSLGESSACVVKKSASDQAVSMNTVHAGNSDPSGDGVRNNRPTCTVSAAKNTEPEKHDHSESQEMEINNIDDCSLRISPRDTYLFENMGSLPSAINSALLELVGDICPEQTHSSELVCSSSSQTAATKPHEGDHHDWSDPTAQDTLPQTSHSYDSAAYDLTNDDIADILMDSLNDALVSGRNVFTSEVHGDSQHSLWTSSCMDLTATATVFPQENAVLNSSRKQSTQMTVQHAIYPYPNCSVSCVTRNNIDHCPAIDGGSFPQTGVAMQSQNAISPVKSNRPAVVALTEPRAVYSTSVPAIGPQHRIPTIVSQNPSGPYLSGARSSHGSAGVSPDNFARGGDIRTYGGVVGPACPMYPYQNPSYYCVDSSSRPHTAVPGMAHGASSAGVNVDNRQLSVHDNRHDDTTIASTWLTQPLHPQLTAETKYMGAAYLVQSPSQQQTTVRSQSFGAYNPVPVRVPSQQFRLRGPFHHTPRNICPVRQTGAHQHLHQMNVGMPIPGNPAFPRNPDVARHSFMYR